MLNQLEMRTDRIGVLGAPADVERDDRPEALQVAARDVVRRTARQAGDVAGDRDHP